MSQLKLAGLILHENEHLVRKVAASVVGRFGVPVEGRLFLTNRRIIWKRDWFSIPGLSSARLELSLGQIRDCSVGGQVVVLTTQEGETGFIVRQGLLRLFPFWHEKTALEWQRVISQALASRDDA